MGEITASNNSSILYRNNQTTNNKSQYDKQLNNITNFEPNQLNKQTNKQFT